MTRRLLLLVVTLTTGVLFLTPGSASAHYLDGSDPHSTGCDNSASTISAFWSSYVYDVYVELRYSNNCNTAWARISCNDGQVCGGTILTIERVSGPAGYTRYSVNPAGYFSRWTPQVYDGGSNQSRACINWGTAYQECTERL